MILSKMTAAILDDLDYIVDGSAVSLEIVYATDDTRYEPSHSGGATGVIEPLTLETQYITRYNTWK